jgi:hypothetical protein
LSGFVLSQQCGNRNRTHSVIGTADISPSLTQTTAANEKTPLLSIVGSVWSQTRQLLTKGVLKLHWHRSTLADTDHK